MRTCSTLRAPDLPEWRTSAGSCRCTRATRCACASPSWRRACCRASRTSGLCGTSGRCSTRRTSRSCTWRATACSCGGTLPDEQDPRAPQEGGAGRPAPPRQAAAGVLGIGGQFQPRGLLRGRISGLALRPARRPARAERRRDGRPDAARRRGRVRVPGQQQGGAHDALARLGARGPICRPEELLRGGAGAARRVHAPGYLTCDTNPLAPTRALHLHETAMGVKKLFDIAGKVALITGGSRGLGLQMAEALGEMGAKLAITARKQGELDEAAAQLGKQGYEVLTVAGDLSKFDTIPGMVDRVLDKFGTIDVLVNNAGATWGAPAEEYPAEGWNKVMNLNVNAVFFLTQDVGKRVMIPKRSGKIVNISSVAGLYGGGSGMNTIAYNTSKAALLNFTRALASEWGKYGINVNAICPGFFPSKMSRGLLEKIEKSVIAATPLGRLGGDEDLKGTIAFLASDASRHITGQYIAVDGGACIA